MKLVSQALLLLANAAWGSSYVVAKLALQELPAPLLAGLRYTVAAALLWPILAIRVRSRAVGRVRLLPSVGDAARLWVLGLLAVGANGLLSYWGVSLTTATDAALLIVGEVLFTTALGVLLAAERLNLPGAVGLGVGVLGVSILVLGAADDNTASAPARAVGDVLILAGLALEAAYSVLGMRLTRRYDPLVVLTISLSGSALVWLPLIGWYVVQGALRAPRGETVAGVAYLALIATAACYLLWFAVIGRAGASLGALSLLAQPVVGALLGIWLLGDPVTPSTVVGGGCVLGCLALVSLSAPSPVVVKRDRAQAAALGLEGAEPACEHRHSA